MASLPLLRALSAGRVHGLELAASPRSVSEWKEFLPESSAGFRSGFPLSGDTSIRSPEWAAAPAPPESRPKHGTRKRLLGALRSRATGAARRDSGSRAGSDT